ncbi:MAG: hypothetical protein K8823_1549 [Cenarchaeum symbiont of Oopsacas minuta]|nr:hypothetical protein [Cenarchaeum symbiont of Oopsacas minuta]
MNTDEIKAHVIKNLGVWSDETILIEMRSMADNANLPRGFIDGIKRVGEGLQIRFINNYTNSKNKPLALWFEFGTKPHGIDPVKATRLAWKENTISAVKVGRGKGKKRGIRASGKAPAKLSFWIFAKHVDHPGTKAHLAMTRGYKIGIKALRKRIANEVKQYVNSAGNAEVASNG